jgi:hypothetical protein
MRLANNVNPSAVSWRDCVATAHAVDLPCCAESHHERHEPHERQRCLTRSKGVHEQAQTTFSVVCSATEYRSLNTEYGSAAAAPSRRCRQRRHGGPRSGMAVQPQQNSTTNGTNHIVCRLHLWLRHCMAFLRCMCSQYQQSYAHSAQDLNRRFHCAKWHSKA